MLFAIAFSMTSESSAQLDVILESWESGVGNWTDQVGNGAQVGLGADLATSATGATDGSSSLSVTQFGDTFELDPIFNSAYSYNAEVRYSTGDAQLAALNQAFGIGAQHFELQLDVTYVQSQIGGNVNVGIALEGAGAPFNSQLGLAPSTGAANETIRIARPLNDWVVPQTDDTTFFDVSLAMNGDWGGGPATVYFDQLRLVQVSEPTILELEVDRATGATRILNPSSTTSPVEFDYYEIVSTPGSLNPAGWTSLEDTINEGWASAGGASAFDLTEANLQSFSDLNGSESFSLGNAWTTGGDESGVAFRYREPSRPGVLRDGVVTFVGMSNDGCDFDGDGVCDCADVDSLVAEIAAGTNAAGFDLNGDGMVNTDDLDEWLASAGAMSNASGNPFLSGDANLDGTVDVSDFNAWNGNKFTSTAAWCSGDFNADGVVDVGDFNLWNGNKFTTSDVASVPEPSACTTFLIAIAIAAGLLRRKELSA